MASFKNDFGLSGKLGDVIIYRMGNCIFRWIPVQHFR